MPIVDRRSSLTPQNVRSSDVAQRLVEDIAPQQQQKMMAAFRVQGIQAILYNRVTQGRICTCVSKNHEVSRLSPDGKASTGAINRVLTGGNFGLSAYDSAHDEFAPEIYSSPNDPVREWLNLSGVGDGDPINQASMEPELGDNGQFSPDLEDIFNGIDMSALGITEVSCPICFGSGYVGGYTPFRGWRHVLVPSDFDTISYLDLPSMVLQPGTHTTKVTLPRGATHLDVFRVMSGDTPVPAKFYLDGHDLTGVRVLDKFDGLPHDLTVMTDHPMSHLEIQVAVSSEPIYFEIPKLSKSSDVSLLERQEPFQIIVSPDIPRLSSQDIIAESQLGKMLIVQSSTTWNTRNRNMLGFECQVRVAQPQELWRILPRRTKVTGQKRVRAEAPTKRQGVSGLSAMKGFTF